MPKPHVIAVAISDLHLTLNRPACRADKDWMAVQAGYLQQVKDLAAEHHAPVLCAGDIFDRWNPPPELIHFALKHLPDEMISVPGQHDLPNHMMDQKHRSAYGVLVQARKIIDLSHLLVIDHCRFNLTVHGFGWEQKIEPLTKEEREKKDAVTVALIHRYVWKDKHSYPGAPETARIDSYTKALKGYDVAVVGDNHMGFLTNAGDCRVLNCGGFIRRKSDEIEYVPKAGLIFSDGTVKRVAYDTKDDVFDLAVSKRDEVPVNMQEFIEGLEKLGEHGLDFREAVINHLKKETIKPKTKEIILAALKANG